MGLFRAGCVIFLSLLLGLVGALPLAASPEGEAIAITATPVPLDDSGSRRVGDLVYLGGWVLSSDHAWFGGWSAMTRAGSRLTLISDGGRWLTATLNLHSDPLLSSAVIGSMAGNSATGEDKKLYDAEAAVRFYPFGQLIAFEQEHRLMVMTEPGAWMKPVSLPPQVTRGLSRNAGFEAMVFDGADRLLLFAEKGRDTGGGLPAWRLSAQADDKQAERFSLMLNPGYSPTAARRLADGRILMITRAFSLLKGVRVEVVSFPEAAVMAGARIMPDRHAHLEAPYAVDNMEAMVLLPTPRGAPPRFLMLADDNFNTASQRTLLLAFEFASSPRD